MTKQHPIFWTVEPVWQGETVFIIGGGPSLRGADFTPIHGKHVVGTNQAFMLGDWVDFVCFGDPRFWLWNSNGNGAGIKQYGGTLVSWAKSRALYKDGRVKLLRKMGRRGIQVEDRSAVCWNLSTGASAINLAVLLGAKEIVLLGFDMKITEGAPGRGHNWHDEYLARQVPNNTIYEERFLKPFDEIKADLDRLGVKCINANPDSALEVFEKVTLAQGMELD